VQPTDLNEVSKRHTLRPDLIQQEPSLALVWSRKGKPLGGGPISFMFCRLELGLTPNGFFSATRPDSSVLLDQTLSSRTALIIHWRRMPVRDAPSSSLTKPKPKLPVKSKATGPVLAGRLASIGRRFFRRQPRSGSPQQTPPERGQARSSNRSARLSGRRKGAIADDLREDAPGLVFRRQAAHRRGLGLAKRCDGDHASLDDIVAAIWPTGDPDRDRQWDEGRSILHEPFRDGTQECLRLTFARVSAAPPWDVSRLLCRRYDVAEMPC
jgi:hypothetical protein